MPYCRSFRVASKALVRALHTTTTQAVPSLGWLPQVLRRSPLPDILCGVTVAAVVIPQGIAYSVLAGLPPIYGLYTAVLPPLAYMLFGTCMHLVVGPFAIIAHLSAQGVAAVVPEPHEDPAAAVAAASMLALLSGLLLLGLGLLRMGSLATLLSDSVLSGYCTAVSIIIPTAQLKYAFQVTVHRGTFLQTVAAIAQQVGHGRTNFAALAVFTVSICTIAAVQYLNGAGRIAVLSRFPIPAELVVVVLSTLVCSGFGLGDPQGPGVTLLGRIPEGLPTFRLPDIHRFNLSQLAPAAAIIAVISYIASMSASKTFGRKYGYEVNNNHELVALGLANVAGSISSCFPAAASLSRTAIAASCGAASPLHNVFTVGILLLVLQYLSPLLEGLPLAALAAIVVMAFKNLLLEGLAEMRNNWRVSTSDFLIWNVALWSTLLTDVTIGIFISVAANLLDVLWRTARPPHAVLGRVEGTPHLYRDRRYFPQAHPVNGLMIFHFDGPLHFANRDVFTTALWDELHAHDMELSSAQALQHAGTNKVTAVILDCSQMSHIDVSAVRMLEKLRGDLASRATRLLLARCKHQCHRKLADMGLFEPRTDALHEALCFTELPEAVGFAEGRLSPRERALGAQRAAAAPGSAAPQDSAASKRGASEELLLASPAWAL